MLNPRKLLRHRLRKSPPSLEEADSNLRRLVEEQNSIASVDAAISESKETLRNARSSVGRSMLRKSDEDTDDGNASTLLHAGRQGILDAAARRAKLPVGFVFDHHVARTLADELHRQLVTLTNNVPTDILAAKALEAQIQSALRSYSNSIQRLLTPMTFR